MLLLALAVAALAGCAAPDVGYQQKEIYIDPGHIEIRNGIAGKTFKFYDAEESVVCYVYRFYESSSMQCLPYNYVGEEEIVEQASERQYGD